MQMTRYNDSTTGKMISMRCRRSLNNPDVIVLDNTLIQQVYVYAQTTLEDVIGFLQDVMNLDIRTTDQSPVTFKLLHHESTGYIYLIPHEDDKTRDDYHAFFAPRDDEE